MPPIEPARPTPGDALTVDGMFDEACRQFDRGNLAEAARLCHAVVDTRRDHGPAFQMLGALAYRQKRFGLSVDFFRQAALLMPDDMKARSNLATALSAWGNHKRAALHFRNVLAMMPDLQAAHYNLGNVLQRMHRFDAALDSYRRALTLDPDNVDAHWNLALLHLRVGRCAEGWPEYEWRWRRPGTPLEHRSAPAWDGGPLDGRTLLLVCEQGLGDTLQFVRYLPLVATRGGSVILRCQPELVRLLSAFSGVARVIAQGEPLPPFDVQASLISLPHLFGTTLDTIPAACPYLLAPNGPLPALPDTDKPGGELKVGLVWGSSATDPSRTCPLAPLAQLSQTPGVRLYSLQKGPHATELARAADAGRIVDLSERINDMADTAALIGQLDLVITVDTSIAHLAGALGRPTWILLPHLADWRWLLDREDSPWYPTARLFRQAAPGDWGGVVTQLQIALQQAAMPERRALVIAEAVRVILRRAALLQRNGHSADADAALSNGLKQHPHSADLHLALGSQHAARGQIPQAIACFEHASAAEPGFARVLHNLGVMERRRGRSAQAETAFARAARLDPSQAGSALLLGEMRLARGDRANALAPLRHTATLQPADDRTHLLLATLRKGMDDPEQAIVGFTRAVVLAPQNITARLGLCMARLPVLYDRATEIAEKRRRYRAELEALISTPLDSPDAIEAAAAAVGSFQPYYLAYQGECDRDLQEMYGRFLCQVMAARHPQWAERPPMPPAPPGAPLRVGIASGFFRWHTVWKLMIRGWMNGLDPARIQLFGYHTGTVRDAQTATASRRFHRFVANQSPEAVAKAIRADNLHVLIYPEIGMDPMAVKLAALRLAPVQCVSWGHPDTTGMPSIDHFISSDLMEPEGAETHYSETLLRLPGIGIGYGPLEVKPESTDFAAFGVRPQSTVYLCCQYVAKYLPQHDDVFARIAAAIPDSQFLFINPRSKPLTARLRRRLDAAFARFGLDSARHVVILPYLTPAQYAALNQRADVYLDSIGWSGGNTTLEAVAEGLPVVTLPGTLMRGRHSGAILNQIGVTDTIADSVDDYVAIAARLGADPAWRRSVSARVADGRRRLYDDARPLRALEDALERWVADAINAPDR